MGIGLSLFVKGHYHHCRTLMMEELRVMDKGVDALFIEKEQVTMPLPWKHTLESFHDIPF
ncbi:hypothetical protein ACNKHP_15365 [Shigella boydii]